MGSRGPAPKDPANRLRRNADQGPNIILLKGGVEKPPPAPKGLPKVLKDEWAAYFTSPVAQAVDAASDLPNLNLLFHLKHEVIKCEAAAKGKEMVSGSTGQPMLNPLIKRADALLGEIRQLSDRFGMTPTARARLGIQIGQVQKSLEEMNASLANTIEEEEADPRLEAKSR